ncbi:response regulator transcription factor [Sphingobacterium sp. SGL-16]|jgi:two-component system alkaline phosphatase synthesis response regulator PhoP|uniref:Response regulator transcription factor n=2 Tax=Sphingobacterium TaxID=28453 RepID=A0ABR7YCK0_9SPHI|nr:MULTISPECIES: response regulator transcription factor [Sphingobacterium]MBD1429026.1 response regulator transcription factor [Sphingobacterium litopenaei]NGM72374.1 response regulator transcription factor [Sphingobacterium sp. SGL-16]
MDRDITIAVIEDDENLRFLISHRLQTERYKVVQSGNGVEAEELILSVQPDIVLLDWMLPGKEGIDVCQSVRKQGFENIIIMMTAKSQDVDKIDAYSHGITDYITKPFNMDVLVAMIDNKVRFFVPKSANKDVYFFGNTEHHPQIHSLIRDGKKIELTILENRILLHFLQNMGKEITREELMEVVWGYSSNVNTRTLDMHVVRLRKKIESNPDKPSYLQTVRGLGYKFVDEE